MKIKKRHLGKFFKIYRTGNLRHLWSPKIITIVPTLACNLNCRMCHQKDIRRCGEREMTINEFSMVLDNLKKLKVTQINLIGGEIFVDKKRGWKMINLMEEKGFLYSLGTNCFNLNLDDVLKMNCLWGLVEVEISLDGPEKVHDEIRGIKGAFKKTIELIKVMKTYEIPIMSVSVLQEKNLNYLKELADILKSLNVDTSTFIYENSISEKDKLSSEKILEKFSGNKPVVFTSTSIDEFCFNYDYEVFKSKVNDLINYCKKIKLNYSMGFELERGDKNIFEYVYDKTARLNHYVSCNFLKGLSQVDWTGAVDICPFIRINNNLFATGILDEKLFEEKLRNIQEKIKKNNLLPICSRCCGIKVGDSK